MVRLALFLLVVAVPARADLAGACAYAGVSSDCLNKPQWRSQIPDRGSQNDYHEPACDAECRRRYAEWEQRVLDALPPVVVTQPLEPDPEEETVWHFAAVGERDQKLEVQLASGGVLILGLGFRSHWVGAVVLSLVWVISNREQLQASAIAMIRDLTRERAAARNDTRECRDAVAASDAFCKGNSCKSGLGTADPCGEARRRMTKGRLCLLAREMTRDVCHDGVDNAEHADEVTKAEASIATCMDKIRVHCSCDDPAGLGATASNMCASLPDCASAFTCAAALTAVEAARFCRYALENIGLICPQAAVPLELATLGPVEAACRQAVLTRCGRIP